MILFASINFPQRFLIPKLGKFIDKQEHSQAIICDAGHRNEGTRVCNTKERNARFGDFMLSYYLLSYSPLLARGASVADTFFHMDAVMIRPKAIKRSPALITDYQPLLCRPLHILSMGLLWMTIL